MDEKKQDPSLCCLPETPSDLKPSADWQWGDGDNIYHPNVYHETLVSLLVLKNFRIF